jgi:hypothetical protein
VSRLCRRFSRLVGERRDRPLAPAELEFIEIHRQKCTRCQDAERLGCDALDHLALLRLDGPPSPGFDVRTLRRWFIARQRARLVYWSPAIVGALVAAMCLMAALQTITRSRELPGLSIPDAEAKRTTPSRLALPFSTPHDTDPLKR